MSITSPFFPHVDHMLREYYQIAGRAEGLRRFIESLEYEPSLLEKYNICDREVTDLNVQLHHMDNYKNALNSRIYRAISINPDNLEYPQQHTEGTRIIGRFNPTSHPGVQAIKTAAIDLIDTIQSYSGRNPGERVRNAKEHIEIGTMLGVKSIFHED